MNRGPSIEDCRESLFISATRCTVTVLSTDSNVSRNFTKLTIYSWNKAVHRAMAPKMTTLKMIGFSLVICFIICTDIFISSASSYNRYNKQKSRGSSYDSEKKLIDALRGAKRTNGWNIELCGRYDDWCTPNSDNAVLVCCTSYRCKCSLWNSACRCRSSLFGKK